MTLCPMHLIIYIKRTQQTGSMGSHVTKTLKLRKLEEMYIIKDNQLMTNYRGIDFLNNLKS